MWDYETSFSDALIVNFEIPWLMADFGESGIAEINKREKV